MSLYAPLDLGPRFPYREHNIQQRITRVRHLGLNRFKQLCIQKRACK